MLIQWSRMNTTECIRWRSLLQTKEIDKTVGTITCRLKSHLVILLASVHTDSSAVEWQWPNAWTGDQMNECYCTESALSLKTHLEWKHTLPLAQSQGLSPWFPLISASGFLVLISPTSFQWILHLFFLSHSAKLSWNSASLYVAILTLFSPYHVL